jgi:hypothetical protein
MFKRLLPLFVLAILFSLPLEARADAVVITTGHITFDYQYRDDPTFALKGDGFLLHGIAAYIYVGRDFIDARPGAMTSLSRTYDADSLMVQGPFMAGGVTYPFWDNGVDYLVIHLDAASFTFPDPAEQFVTFESTFTMDGTVGARLPGSSARQLTNIVGQGVVTATYHASGNNGWFLTRLDYRFQTTPTPEPATIVLLGTGLGGVAAATYRRRKRRK